MALYKLEASVCAKSTASNPMLTVLLRRKMTRDLEANQKGRPDVTRPICASPASTAK